MNKTTKTIVTPAKKGIETAINKTTNEFLNYGLVGVIALLAIIYIIWDRKNIEKRTNVLLETSAKNNNNDIVNKLVDTLDNKHSQDLNEIKNVVTEFKERVDENLKDLRKEISDVYIVVQKKEDTEKLNKKYEAIMRNKLKDAIPYFKDKALRRFVIQSCKEFIDWVLDVKEDIFIDNDSFNLSIEQAKAKSNTIQNECVETLGINLTKSFYDSQNVEYGKYVDKCEKIKNDKINDKINKFVNTSILYMQDYISNLLNVWIDGKGDEVIYDETINGLDEMRKEERKL